MDNIKFKYGDNEINVLLRWFKDISDHSIYIKIEMMEPKKQTVDTIRWSDSDGKSLYDNKTATQVAKEITLSYIKKNGLE